MQAGYVAVSRAQALAAATAETMVNIINAANSLVRVVEFGVSFDGVTATAVPVQVDLCLSTQAGAGTAAGSTITQIRGATRTVQATAGTGYTAEPTVLTVIKTWYVRADGGLFVMQFPLGREPMQSTTADGICVRATAPAGVNADCYIEFEEG